jgi:hypothetical protein
VARSNGGRCIRRKLRQMLKAGTLSPDVAQTALDARANKRRKAYVPRIERRADGDHCTVRARFPVMRQPCLSHNMIGAKL